MKNEYERLLDNLLASPETEVIEFKEAKDSFDFKKIGKYFSALSNEANLNNIKEAWLIFGIRDSDHEIVGTNYRKDSKLLNSLKGEIAKQTTEGVTLIDIIEIFRSSKRVIMLKIPAAPKGLPVAFKGHYYGRNGEELSPLNIQEIERIRQQVTLQDWSAITIPDAKIVDLDANAIRKAKDNYIKKFPDKAEEVESWNNITFLNKVRLAIKGQLTNAAILLLGKEESISFVAPANPQIRWELPPKNSTT